MFSLIHKVGWFFVRAQSVEMPVARLNYSWKCYRHLERTGKPMKRKYYFQHIFLIVLIFALSILHVRAQDEKNKEEKEADPVSVFAMASPTTVIAGQELKLTL